MRATGDDRPYRVDGIVSYEGAASGAPTGSMILYHVFVSGSLQLCDLYSVCKTTDNVKSSIETVSMA